MASDVEDGASIESFDDPPHPKYDKPYTSVVEVQRDLSGVLRRLKAGIGDHSRAMVLINGYGVLAKMMRDTTVEEFTQRLVEIEARVH